MIWKDGANIINIRYKYYAKDMRIQCKYDENAIQTLGKYNAHNMQIPCKYDKHNINIRWK